MKNPYQDIQRAKQFVKTLSSKLEYIKSSVERDFQIDALNSFITLINSYESFLASRYVLKSVEGLLCGRLYSMMFNSLMDSKNIDISEVVRKLDNDIKYPEIKKATLISMLNTENIQVSIEKNGELPLEDEMYWTSMVDDLLMQLKTQMLWS